MPGEDVSCQPFAEYGMLSASDSLAGGWRDVAQRSVRRHTLRIPTPPETDVVTITVDRGSHIELAFADGMVCRIGLTELRLACPCAACEVARGRGRSPWPPAGQREATLAVIDAKLLGYGLGITWSDGHSTGIYAFEALRRWCEDADGDASTT